MAELMATSGNFASQGQARSLVLALKLAELEAARRQGLSPLFLLDDLTSELDQAGGASDGGLAESTTRSG